MCNFHMVVINMMSNCIVYVPSACEILMIFEVLMGVTRKVLSIFEVLMGVTRKVLSSEL